MSHELPVAKNALARTILAAARACGVEVDDDNLAGAARAAGSGILHGLSRWDATHLAGVAPRPGDAVAVRAAAWIVCATCGAPPPEVDAAALHAARGRTARDLARRVLALGAGAALIAAVRARGSDVQDVRDAAHEAAHALPRNLRDWSRRSVDRAMQRIDLKRRLREETTVRAMEQVVCRELGAPCPSVEACALTTAMETLHYERVSIDPETFAAGVHAAMTDRATLRLARRVVDFATGPLAVPGAR